LSGCPKEFDSVVDSGDVYYPTLLTGDWCPFSLTAKSFWEDIADETGIDLKIVDVESDEGARLKALAHVTGVPSLLVSSDTVVYGVQVGRQEAKRLFQALKES